jgi:hypothetical protein
MLMVMTSHSFDEYLASIHSEQGTVLCLIIQKCTRKKNILGGEWIIDNQTRQFQIMINTMKKPNDTCGTEGRRMPL